MGRQRRADVFKSVQSQLCSVLSSSRSASRGQMYPTHLACGCILFELETTLRFDTYLWWMDLHSRLGVWKTPSLRALRLFGLSTCCFLWGDGGSTGVSSVATRREDDWAGSALSLISGWVLSAAEAPPFRSLSVIFGPFVVKDLSWLRA